MVIIFGDRLYGKTDVVPGLFHVATRFFHVFYFPLVPEKMWVIFRQTAQGWNGIPIPGGWMSVLLAWLRALMVVALFVAGITLLVGLGDASHFQFEPAYLEMPMMAGSAIVALSALLIGSYLPMLTRASHARARRLAELACLPDEIHILIDQIYKKIPAEEAAGQLHFAQRQRETHARAEAAKQPATAIPKWRLTDTHKP